MLVKLKVEARPEAQEQADAVSAVLLLAGGVVTEELGLCHYTQNPEVARAEWQLRGFEIVEEAEVELKEGGFGRLLEDLRRIDQ